MIAKRIDSQDPQALPAALAALESGRVVAFPTDTVYGLGCLVHSSAAIDRLYQVKERDTGKAIAVLIGDIDHLPRVTGGLSGAAQRLAAHFWPGALTLVVPRNPDLPGNLSPLPTIGIRMPNHSFALALLKKTGPLAVTSANLSGLPSPVTAQEVLEQLQERVDLVIDGGACPGGIPSTVVDCTGAEPRILREGALTREMLRRVLGEDF